MNDVAVSCLNWLKERHAAQKSFEKEAWEALYGQKDQDAYNACMAERARVIASLDADAAAKLEGAQDPFRSAATVALGRIATGARTALKLDSVFYMSALLYPDDHKKGEPDNLELLINELSSL